MKNNKICPKCKSNDIIRVNGGTGAYGAGNNIPTGRNGIVVIVVIVKNGLTKKI